jgi:hypothetical protein
MNATEINQRLQEINILLTIIYNKLLDIKAQRSISNISS